MGLWLADYGRAVLVLGLGFCLGYPLVRRFLRGTFTVPLSVLMGLGLLSLVVCLLSWAHIFTRGSIAIVAALALAATAPCLVVDLPRWRRRWRPDVPLLICLTTLLVVVAGFSWFALYPVTVGDAVNYHLPLAHNLVAAHGLRYDPFVRYSFFPQANEALFAIVLMLAGNGTAAGALEWGLVATAAFALLLWFPASGRRPAAGLIAALVLLGSPAVVWVGTSPMIDDGALSFTLVGLLVGLEAAEDRIPVLPGFIAMGLLFGVAAASKYTAIVFDVAAAIAVLIAARRRGRLGLPLAGLVWGALVTAGPWYAWTVHVTGDPVYPFATSLFGNAHGLWTSAELQLQNAASRGGAQPGIVGIIKQDIHFLLGHVPYNTGLHRSPLSWWLASGYLGFLLPRARRDRLFLGLAVAGVIAVATWVFSSADPRYFMPGVGILALFAGVAADHALALWDTRRVRLLASALLRPLWCAIACAALLWTSIGYVTWYIGYAGGGPPTSGPAVAAYLRAQIFCYPAVELLNEQLSSHYRAWAWECEGARWYADGLLVGDAFSAGGRDRILNSQGGLPPARTLWDRLERFHVQWIIVPTLTPAMRVELDAHGLFSYVATAGDQEIFAVAPTITGARRS
jgi:4-amino-4-deoxy-L-arabinose transferase-like glycosyltransferase